MAIRLITGVPGAGKSFYAVKHLRDNYYTYDPDKDVWITKKNITVISNIDSLKLVHKSLDEILKNYKGGVNEFFTVDEQKKVGRKYPQIVYFLDECQQYFPRKFYDEQVFFYFQYHRHLGHDVYLITQSKEVIPKELRGLCELEIRAVRRSLSVFGEFRYSVRSGNDVLKMMTLKRAKGVFDLYQSMEQDESEKTSNPLIKKVAVGLGIMVVGLVVFIRVFTGSWPLLGKKTESEAAVPSERKVMVREDRRRVRPKPNQREEVERKYKWPVSHAVVAGEVFVVDMLTGRLTRVREANNEYRVEIVRGKKRVFAMLGKRRIEEERAKASERIDAGKRTSESPQRESGPERRRNQDGM